MHADKVLKAFKRHRPMAITHLRAALQDASLTPQETTRMSTNASTIPSPILDGDAPLPFANTNIPTQPTAGPMFTHAKMYHAWKNIYIHTPSKWHMPSPSSVSTVSMCSTNSLPPQEATTVSLRGPGNTPYPTIVSLGPTPIEQNDVASPTLTHFTISTPSCYVLAGMFSST